MRAELQPSQVEPGVLLEVDDVPRKVIGSLSFDKGGVRWREHCLETTPGPHEWLSIRPRGGLTVVHWTPRHDLFGDPDQAGMTIDGREWTLDDAGSATYTSAGDTGTGASGECDYVEFSDADGLLVFESFDGSVWEISVGRLVDPSTVRSYRSVRGSSPL